MSLFKEPTLVHTFQEHTAYVYSISFSPLEWKLVSTGGKKEAMLWNLTTNEKICDFSGHASDVESVHFSPTGEMIATGSGNSARLWKLGSGIEGSTGLSGHTNTVRSVRFNNDGHRICTTSSDDTVKIWDVEVQESLLTLNHAGSVYGGRFSDDNRTVVTGAWDQKVKIWDLRMEENCVHTFDDHNSDINCVAVHTGTNCIASGADGGAVNIFDIRSPKLLQSYGEHGSSVKGVDFHPTGNFLISGAADKTYKIYDLMNRKVIYTNDSFSDYVRDVQFSSDGAFFATGDDDNNVKLWRTNFFSRGSTPFQSSSKSEENKVEEKEVQEEVEGEDEEEKKGEEERMDLSFWNEEEWKGKQIERILYASEHLADFVIPLHNKTVHIPKAFLVTSSILSETLSSTSRFEGLSDLSLKIDSIKACQLILLSDDQSHVLPILQTINLIDYFIFFRTLGLKGPMELIISHLEGKTFKELYLLLQECAKKYENEIIKSWFSAKQKRGVYTESLFDTSLCLACFIQMKKKSSALDSDPSLFMIDMFVGMMRGHLMLWKQEEDPMEVNKHKDIVDAKDCDLAAVLDELYNKKSLVSDISLQSSDGKVFQVHKAALCCGFLDRFFPMFQQKEVGDVIPIDLHSSILELVYLLTCGTECDPSRAIGVTLLEIIQLICDFNKHKDMKGLFKSLQALETMTWEKEEVTLIVRKTGHLLHDNEMVCGWVIPVLVKLGGNNISKMEILKIARKSFQEYSVTHQISKMKERVEEVAMLRKENDELKSRMEGMVERMRKIEGLLSQKFGGDL